MSVDIEAERDRFEAWIRDHYADADSLLGRHRGWTVYANFQTQAKFDVWLAAKRDAAQSDSQKGN